MLLKNFLVKSIACQNQKRPEISTLSSSRRVTPSCIGVP